MSGQQAADLLEPGSDGAPQSTGRAYSCRNQSILGIALSLAHPTCLHELLNYRLMRLHALSGAPVVRLLEGRYGIARREWGMLGLLASRGPLSPSALADEAQLDRPRTSRAVGSLVAKGLVLRRPLPGDHRRAQVALTAAGQALFDTVFPHVAALNADLVAALDADLVDALDRALAQLTEAARRHNGDRVQDVRADRRSGGRRRA
jgi:DNA-binding MarR family transcriptional regulator